DRGRSWSLAGTYDVPSPEGNVVAYQIINASTWYLKAPTSTSTMVTTMDSGATWSAHASDEPGSNIGGFSFADAKNGWALANFSGCTSVKSGCYDVTN